MHPYGNLHHVIPTKVGIQFFEFQSFPINCLSIECLDSRLCGNDDSYSGLTKIRTRRRSCRQYR
ncbi:hypothetical protein A6J50_14520 [Neisseria meningitidis]|nr:hypothetical protein A6J54_14285 [Neisseria meningitidis]AVH83341.1 hypothetical protein A6J50_14520 [Neisseria meningitidis]